MSIYQYQYINISIYTYQYINISVYQYINIAIYGNLLEIPAKRSQRIGVYAPGCAPVGICASYGREVRAT